MSSRTYAGAKLLIHLKLTFPIRNQPCSFRQTKWTVVGFGADNLRKIRRRCDKTRKWKWELDLQRSALDATRRQLSTFVHGNLNTNNEIWFSPDVQRLHNSWSVVMKILWFLDFNLALNWERLSPAASNPSLIVWGDLNDSGRRNTNTFHSWLVRANLNSPMCSCKWNGTFVQKCATQTCNFWEKNAAQSKEFKLYESKKNLRISLQNL